MLNSFLHAQITNNTNTIGSSLNPQNVEPLNPLSAMFANPNLMFLNQLLSTEMFAQQQQQHQQQLQQQKHQSSSPVFNLNSESNKNNKHLKEKAASLLMPNSDQKIASSNPFLDPLVQYSNYFKLMESYQKYANALLMNNNSALNNSQNGHSHENATHQRSKITKQKDNSQSGSSAASANRVTASSI